MSKKKKTQVGDVLVIKSEHAEAVEKLHDLMKDAEFASKHWAKEYRKLTGDFWDFIRSQFPEADGYGLSYSEKDKKIAVTGHANLRQELQDRSAGCDANVTQILDIAKEMLVERQQFEEAATVRDISDSIKRCD